MLGQRLLQIRALPGSMPRVCGVSVAAKTRRTGRQPRRPRREDHQTMAAKGKKTGTVAGVPAEVSVEDRTALTGAYKAGLILAWKFDIERGYCLTLAGRPEEYVQVGRLTQYLEALKPS